ncbi:MAG: orotate phosphoribosyltransferase [Acidiferrobacterales bacterium]
MQDYQREFIDFAVATGAIRFGEFTLKSGRVSPYFFNAGLFNTGESLGQLGRFYARAIMESKIEFDMLFGPAYKGIPLAAATAIALAEHHNRDTPFAFNRKEKKQHAEGGLIVGHPLQGRVLIIDDVISSGISVNEAVEIIRAAGATPAGVVIAVDRQERGSSDVSAVQEVESTHSISVTSIIKLETLIPYLKDSDGLERHVQAIEAYRKKYGE